MTREEFVAELDGLAKLVRTEYGVSQEVMARVLGISKKTLVEVEKGRRSLGWTGAAALCAIFSDSQVLSGPPGPEKEDYLAQEGARLDQLQEEYATVLSAAQQSSGLMVYAESLAAQLRAQRPFDQARAQYNALLPGQSYVYTTPYERLYDAGGMAADRVDLAKLLLALALVLPFFFCMEGETGVIALIRAAGAEGAVRRRKRAAAWLFALGCALAAFLPRMLAVAAALGLPELTARANSLPRFAGLPDILPLWGVLALSMAARAGLAVAGAAAVEWISARARAPIPAVLASLLLPGLALLSAGLG